MANDLSFPPGTPQTRCGAGLSGFFAVANPVFFPGVTQQFFSLVVFHFCSVFSLQSREKFPVSLYGLLQSTVPK